LKILFIIPSYRPAYIYGGPIEAVANLAESLVKLGHEVDVFTTNANGGSDLDVPLGTLQFIDGVNVYYFKRVTRKHTNLSLELITELKKTIRKYDMIHIHSWWNLVTLPAAWICLANHITPYISPRGTLTTYTFTHRNGIAKRILHILGGKKLLEQSILLYTSAPEREEALKFIQPKHDHILPNIHKFPIPVLSEKPNQSYLDILFLGRIDPAKNLEFLLHITTCRLRVPYRLTMAGYGDSQYIQKLKELFPNQEHVDWIGIVEGDEKYSLLASADVTVLPSHTENYGNVVLECLSQGTPVIISDKVGLKDYVQANGLGLVLETEEEKWIDALEQIWNQKPASIAFREKAILCIRRDFDPIRTAQMYIDVYGTYRSVKHSKG